MKNKVLSICLCFFLMGHIYQPLFAAAFGPTKSLVSIPVAEYFIPGDLEFAVNSGFSSFQNLEFDFKLNYSLTKKINVGAAVINYHQIIFNAQTTFVTLSDPFPIKISAGLLNLSSKLDLSDWDNESAQKIHNLGHFVVASMPKEKYTLHVGIGKKKYHTIADSAEVESNTGPFIGSFFFGVEKPLKTGKIMAEFDGSYLNFGYQKNFTKKVQGRAALTEFGNSGGNAPVRFLSFNLSTARNIFDVYKDEVQNVQNNLNTIEDLSLSLKSTERKLRSELVRVQKTKEELIQKIQTVGKKPKPVLGSYSNDELDMYSQDHVMAYSHYENAFSHFGGQNYLNVLESLTKAIDLAPNVSIFHRQRGSVYYILKQQENALDDWTSAYKLNPQDKELLKLPRRFLEEIKRRAKF
eukprot:COSAG05_NODE_236_length_13185_cov_2.137781_9_plen_409_part_00